MKGTLVTLVAFVLTLPVFAVENQSTVVPKMQMTPPVFAKNMGQWPDSILFRVDAGGAVMWFTRDGVYYQYFRKVERADVWEFTSLASGAAEEARPHVSGDLSDSIETTMIKAQYVGANPDVRIVELEELDWKCNYFLGADPDMWRTDVPNYSGFVLQGLYPGVDVAFHIRDGQLVSDIHVAAAGALEQVEVVFPGVPSRPNGDGTTVLETRFGELLFRGVMPQTDSSRVSRPGEAGGKSATDLLLSYSTYLGGSGTDHASSIAIDRFGSAYVAGYTASIDFPTQTPYQLNKLLTDAFVTKLSPSGSTLAYSTYLGGIGEDLALTIAVDSLGCAFVAGSTNSSNFPTQSPYQNFQGNVDAFVTKLSPSGNSLVFSTFLGGSYADEYAMSVAVDSLGSAYLAGYTNSSNFPTRTPYQAQLRGINDAFVAKFAPSGSSLVYSTYLGGSDNDYAYAITLDSAGAVFIGGSTNSSNFPTHDPFQTDWGGYDAFLTKLSPSGTALVYSTYIGGEDGDYANAVGVDSAGCAYLAGSTFSQSFPTQSAFQSDQTGEDGFLAKFSSAGSSLIFCTYLGGDGDDFVKGLVVAAKSSVFLVGYTSSTNFPTNLPFQTYQYGDDAFVSWFHPTGNSLLYSTYVGGTGDDSAFAIAVSADCHAFVVGSTESSDFPTVAPFQTNQWFADAFAFKLSITDADADSFPDPIDNCATTPNTEQIDSDGDQVGDVCDNCPHTYNPYQEDRNIDGTGDSCEASTYCDSLHYQGAASYYWQLPDYPGYDFFNMLFSNDAVARLKSIYLYFYGPGSHNISGEGVDVVVWDDDGSGLPGTEIVRVQVPWDSLKWYPVPTAVNVSRYDVVVTGDFHVGYTPRNKIAGDTIAILSDDGVGVCQRSSAYCGDSMWCTVLANFFVEAVVCYAEDPRACGVPDSWAMCNHDPARTGATTMSAQDSWCDLSLNWRYSDYSINPAEGPVIFDGKVACTFREYVKVFDLSTGTLVQTYQLIEPYGVPMRGAPLITRIGGYPDPVMFVSLGANETVDGVNFTTGEKIWSSSLSRFNGNVDTDFLALSLDVCSPGSNPDLLVYTTCDGAVAAVDPLNGLPFGGWDPNPHYFDTYNTQTRLTTDGNGHLFVSIKRQYGASGDILCIDVRTGNIMWSLSSDDGLQAASVYPGTTVTSEQFPSRAAYDAETQTLIVISWLNGDYPADGVLYRLDASTGAVLSAVACPRSLIRSTPIIGPTSFFVTTSSHWYYPWSPQVPQVLAFNKFTGEQVWSAGYATEPIHYYLGSGVLTCEGDNLGDYLYLVDYNGFLRCLDASDGREVFTRRISNGGELGNSAISSVVGSDQEGNMNLIVTDTYGNIYDLVRVFDRPRLEITNFRYDFRMYSSTDTSLLLELPGILKNTGCSNLVITELEIDTILTVQIPDISRVYLVGQTEPGLANFNKNTHPAGDETSMSIGRSTISDRSTSGTVYGQPLATRSNRPESGALGGMNQNMPAQSMAGRQALAEEEVTNVGIGDLPDAREQAVRIQQFVPATARTCWLRMPSDSLQRIDQSAAGGMRRVGSAGIPPYLNGSGYTFPPADYVIAPGDSASIVINVNPSLLSDSLINRFYIRMVSNDPDYFLNDTILKPEVRVDLVVRPSNDDCENAIHIAETDSLAFSTIGALTDGPAEPYELAGCSPHKDVWYVYTPSCSSMVSVSTCGSDFDTWLSIYDTTACSYLTDPIACDDDSCGPGAGSWLTFHAQMGHDYLIRIGGNRETSGHGKMTIGLVDTDSDGLGDACDDDDDNDGITDDADTDPINPKICADADGDGCDDCAIGTDDFGPLADNLPANDGTDTDADGLCDAGDNCPTVHNPDQVDSDGDNIGDACDYTSGDANGDGQANVGDAVYIINYVFKGGAAPNPECRGDANCDGDCNVGDAVYLINYVFKGGAAPCAGCE